MTQSINKPDFKEQLAAYDAKKAIDKAFDAPAVKTVKQGLVPAPKAAKTSPVKKSGKAGRIVGISKDENAYIQELLDYVAGHPDLGESNPNFAKIEARYNK